MSDTQNINHYYDSSQLLYSIFIYNSKTYSMHFGFWDKNTKNIYQAQENQNQAIIEYGNITKKHKVLDAGCGMGGTCFHIAEKTKADIIGININANQINHARKVAKKRGLESNCTFLNKNYYKTDFADNTFDVIYGNESICYAYPKEKFLKEAFRILKPGGKLVIADGYTVRDPKSKPEKELVKTFNKSFAMEEFISSKKMATKIKQNGFTDVRVINKIEEVKPTILYFRKLTKLATPVYKLISWIKIDFVRSIKRHLDVFKCVDEGVSQGLFTYSVHVAKKPK